MKIWILSIVCVVVGLVAGTVSGLWETDVLFRVAPVYRGVGVEPDPNIPALAPADGPQPKVVVDGAEYDFGQMERGTKGQHSFLFKNVGEFPLKLRKGKTTCKCTLANLSEADVPPGGSTEVVLEWTAKSPDLVFRHGGTIHTNDPKRPNVELSIVGRVVESIEVTPTEIVFSNLTSEEQSTGKTRVFTSLGEGLSITGFACENTATAAFFDMHSEALPPDALPPGMTSGCEVTVTVKPGLPKGNIQQRILLHLSVPGVEKLPDAEVGIGGRIGSPILVVGGREWNSDQGTLRLGTLSSEKGATRQLKLMIRGPRRQEVELRAPQAEPAMLKATLGERLELETVVAVPLTIEIPPGSPAANHLGSSLGAMGEVTIETVPPELGPIRLKVAFAIAK